MNRATILAVLMASTICAGAALAAGPNEMSLVTAEARSATGRALVDTQALFLPAARFRALLAANSIAAHKMVAAIAEVLARRLGTMNGVVLQLAGNPGSAGTERSPLKTQDLAALHRTMQVWSF